MKILKSLFLSILMLMTPLAYAATDTIILIADPRILAVPVSDNQEPLIDLKDQKEIAYGPSPEIPHNSDYTKLRKSVYEKLLKAQALLPKGVHFCLYEGYRSLALQKMLFDKRYAEIKHLHPQWTAQQIFIETTRLVSPVTNLDGSKNVPPHSTGGAIDIYLVDDQGKTLPMGMHPKDWVGEDGSIALTASKRISREAQHNRQIMAKALTALGFVNYPTEYWHWSYGDRYWAYQRQMPRALYGTYSGS